MAEGGFYPWKVNKIRLPESGGVPGKCRYQDLSKPLPNPPKGQVWVQNVETKEWTLSAVVVADAIEGAAIGESNPVGNLSTCVDDSHHELKPTDTLQGLCLRYGVTATELRRANKILSGEDLRLWPKQLVIPAKKSRGGKAKGKERTREEQVVDFVHHFEHKQRMRSLRRKMSDRVEDEDSQPLGSSEARAYLEMNDWVMEEAIRDAEEALGWAIQNELDAPDDRTDSNQRVPLIGEGRLE